MRCVLVFSAVLMAGCPLGTQVKETNQQPVEVTRCLCDHTEIQCGAPCEGQTRTVREYVCPAGEIVSDPHLCPAAQTPDAGMPDSGTNDAGSTDAGTGDGGMNDAGPSITIRIRRLDPEPVQVIANPDANENLGLSRFSVCTEGGNADIASVTVFLDGSFGELPIRAELAGRAFSRNFGSGQELVLLFADSPPAIADGACKELTLTSHLPLTTPWTRWIKPRVTNVSARQEIRTDYGDNGAAFTPGLRTVFRPEPGLVATAEGIMASEITLPRDAQYSMVAWYRICTEAYQTADVRGAVIEVTRGLPADVPYHVRLQVGYTDPDYRWWDLGTRDTIVSQGDVISWESNRPDGQPENLNWGGCLSFQMTLAFVTQGAEEVQFSLRSVTANTPVSVRNQMGMTRVLPSESPYVPEPWSLIRFADPVPAAPFLQFNWPSPRDPSRADWYLWEGDGTVCEWMGNPVECPLMDVTGYVMGVDQRFPAQIRDVALNAQLSELDHLAVRLLIEKGQIPQITTLRSETITLVAGSNAIQRSINAALEASDGFTIRIRVYLSGPLPAEDATAFTAPRLRFDLVGVNADWVGHALSTYLNAPETPGLWQYALRPLPYQGPDLVFHSPELWLENNTTGAPITVRMTDPVNDTMVMSSTFRNQYGAVQVCELHFTHGTGKMHPIAENIGTQLAGTTFALLEWTESTATFRAPSGECVWVGDNQLIGLSVTIGRALEQTADGRPLQFKLFRLIAYPEHLLAPETPVIARLNGVHKVLLSETEVVSGLPVIITQN